MPNNAGKKKNISLISHSISNSSLKSQWRKQNENEKKKVSQERKAKLIPMKMLPRHK